MKQNNLKTLAVLTKYTFLSTIRNPTAVFFGFAFPFIFIIVFGLIGQSSRTFDIGVLSSSVKSGPVYEALSKIDVVKLVTDKTDDDLNDQLKKGQIPALINIQEQTTNVNGQDIKTYTVNLTTTSASPGDSATVRNILQGLTNSINNPPSQTKFEFAHLNVDNVEGRKYSEIDFILPGQLSFSLLTTGVFTITFSMLTLRKTLVLKRMFATPTPKWVIMLSKVLSTMVMGVLQSSLIIGVGHFAFQFTLVNGFSTFIAMIGLSLLGLLVFLGLGLVVASIANSEDSVSPIANLVTMPQLLLSGSFFPIDAFPPFLKPIAQILPMTFLNDAMRAVAFEGAGFDVILPKILALIVSGILIYALAIKIFKWE